MIVHETKPTISDWILLSKKPEVLQHPRIGEAAQALPRKAGIKAWTDDFHNIVQVLR